MMYRLYDVMNYEILLRYVLTGTGDVAGFSLFLTGWARGLTIYKMLF